MKKYTISEKLLLLFMIFCYWQTSWAQSSIRLKTLGQVVIPYNYSFKNTPVGGLSGLTYNSQNGLFYAISDDRSDGAAARFYSFRVKLNDEKKLEEDGIHFTDVSVLKTPDGKPYARGGIDPEGITIGSDQFVYISSEGIPKRNIGPFINAYSTDGAFARALTIPHAYWNAAAKTHKKWGVRTNLGFEGLTVSPDATTLYGALENALIQDGPAADSLHSSPARIILYDLPSGNIIHEYRYDVAPIYYTPQKHGPFAVNGLSDILALDNRGHLLALERNYVLGQGNRICLYEISTKSATDIKGIENLQLNNHPVNPVRKQLVANLKDLKINIDNFEGLALGPKLPDGGQLLLMVSDNNFSPLQQTIFTAFSLHQK